jgi:hypothetical protein
MRGRYVCRYEPTHAVAHQNDPSRIDTYSALAPFVLKPREGRLGIVEAMREAETARTTPGATIVHRQDVPAQTSHRLCAVEVLLIAWEPMQQQDTRVRPAACRYVKKSVQIHAVARYRLGQGLRWPTPIGRRIAGEYIIRVRQEIGCSLRGGGGNRYAVYPPACFGSEREP